MNCISFRRINSLSASAGFVFAMFVLFQCLPVQSALGAEKAPSAQRPVQIVNDATNIGLPVRLKIPNIRVNAAIRHVGLTPDGAMDIPKFARDTGWYSKGPKPGEEGTAVIDGHVNWVFDWLYATSGVFSRLHALKPGDRISVQDEAGATTTFVVRKSKAYGQKDDASDIFHSYDGKSHLNLITCAGAWDKASKSYSKRLVVFADKVE